MRILIAGTDFPGIGQTLTELLPEDELIHCPVEDLARAIPGSDVLIPAMARIGADLIVGSGLKLIQQWGVGLEGVDLQAAAREGIPVCNVPSAQANAFSTAELAIFLMMAAGRRFHAAQESLTRGPWGFPKGVALVNRHALIVGLGRVGQALAVRLKALGMRISAVKNRPEPELAQSLGLDRLGSPADLESMLSHADFVVSTVIATPQTIGLFNRRMFGLMKPGAVFVNVSRGLVVDEAALVDALDSGRLTGAGLDVFAREPVQPDHPLVRHPKVVAMPHVGGITEQGYEEIGAMVAENIHRVRDGRPPRARQG